MHGQVSFQYFLHKGPGAGTVFFQLFGQKCRVCVRQRRERARAAAPGAGAGAGAEGAAPMTPPPEEEEEVEGAAAPAPVPAAAPAPAPVEDDVPYANPMWYPDEVRRVSTECSVVSRSVGANNRGTCTCAEFDGWAKVGS